MTAHQLAFAEPDPPPPLPMGDYSRPLLEAQRGDTNGPFCYKCGAQPATPHQGDTVPYCDACKREHRRRHALTGDTVS